ncbi:hypothetical protein [uncultured Bradyrhizobium sp.]|uniref:hypothetical protein n=1 Tax=uncultured Bradyrhizobium sp. TaxID=199684 RepID=UPI0035CC0926
MSSTAALERLPNTVTACHAEIRTLREAVGGNKEVREKIYALESERNKLKDRLQASENKVLGLQGRVDELEEAARPDAEVAIDGFLDECERVGPMRYDVPQSDSAIRAILRLHDPVGRQP